MAGIAMGLRDVFEPELPRPHRHRAAGPEQPLEPQHYEVHLDPVAARVVVRHLPPVARRGSRPRRSTEPRPTAASGPGGGAGSLGG